jgi:hypothetical protein
MLIDTIANTATNLLAIYTLIGVIIIVGYLHIIFKEFDNFNITSKLTQLMYIMILIFIWPVFVYYLFKNRDN